MNVAQRRERLPARGKVTTVAGNSMQHETSPRIALLNELPAQELRDEWRRPHRGQPPRLSQDLLIRTIATGCSRSFSSPVRRSRSGSPQCAAARSSSVSSVCFLIHSIHDIAGLRIVSH